MTADPMYRLDRALALAGEVADERRLSRAWIRGVTEPTSIKDPTDLDRQLMGLDAFDLVSEVRSGIVGDPLLADALEDFFNQFQGAYFWGEAALGVGELPLEQYACDLLSSQEWGKAVEAAKSLVLLAEQLGVPPARQQTST